MDTGKNLPRVQPVLNIQCDKQNAKQTQYKWFIAKGSACLYKDEWTDAKESLLLVQLSCQGLDSASPQHNVRQTRCSTISVLMVYC